MQKLKEEIGAVLAPLVEMDSKLILELLEIPPEPDYGDIAFPCFTLAKTMKKSPVVIAEELGGKLSEKQGVYWKTAEPRGPYLNFYITPETYTKDVLKQIWDQQDQFGHLNLGDGANVTVDYSSPNIAKPFGVGHIRSTVIGHSLYLIYRALGYNSIGINHLGDWGTQFGKLIVAFKLWGDDSKLKEDPVDYLYHLYVKFHQEADDKPELDDDARSWFKKLENGNSEAVSYWEHFKRLSLDAYAGIYDRLGIQFEYYHGESHYNQMLDQVVNLVQEKGIAKESEGALIVELDSYNLPPVMLRKKDGATLYITRDLAAAIYRKENFDFARSLYVVGAEQTLHFQQLFKVLELLGFTWASNCSHVPFGMIRFKEGRMSTRAGKIVLLEEVLNRAVEMARDIIEEKNPDLQDKDRAAEAVGLGAVRFGDLYNDRVKNIEFDWEKVLDFSGETAAYIQYAHARICSIIRKAGPDLLSWDDQGAILLGKEEEITLIKTLALLPEKIIDSAESLKPSILARYLIDVAREFNRFYHNCPVLTSDPEIKQARLLLINATRQVLSNGLGLLGIVAPEEM